MKSKVAHPFVGFVFWTFVLILFFCFISSNDFTDWLLIKIGKFGDWLPRHSIIENRTE